MGPNASLGEYQTYIASLNRTIQLNPNIATGDEWLNQVC